MPRRSEAQSREPVWGNTQIWAAARTSIVGQMRAGVFGARPLRDGQGPAADVVAPQAPRAVPDAVVPIEMAAYAHPQARAGPPPGLFGELKGYCVERDDVVLPDGALFEVAEDLVHIDVSHGDEGRGGIGGRPGELLVVGGDEGVAQIGIRGLERGDAVQRELLDEAILQGTVLHGAPSHAHEWSPFHSWLYLDPPEKRTFHLLSGADRSCTPYMM